MPDVLRSLGVYVLVEVLLQRDPATGVAEFAERHGDEIVDEGHHREAGEDERDHHGDQDRVADRPGLHEIVEVLFEHTGERAVLLDEHRPDLTEGQPVLLCQVRIDGARLPGHDCGDDRLCILRLPLPGGGVDGVDVGEELGWSARSSRRRSRATC